MHDDMMLVEPTISNLTRDSGININTVTGIIEDRNATMCDLATTPPKYILAGIPVIP